MIISHLTRNIVSMCLHQRSISIAVSYTHLDVYKRQVEDQLPEGNTTVGAMIQTTHLKPTALGDTVLVTATLREVEGRKLTFSVVASDSQGKIGEGTHIRYVVDRNKFMEMCIRDRSHISAMNHLEGVVPASGSILWH